ncbi:MAG: hypothetical protein ACL93V_13075 [Candidatus Electrothrix sp. YB6]
MNNLRILFLQKTAAVISPLLLFGAVMVVLPGRSTAEEPETEVATAEETGTVDSVQNNAVIISDSFVPVNSSVLLYDQYGKRTELSSFEAGDQVLVTSVEDEVSGEQRIVSVSLMKNTRQNSPSSERPEKKPNQEIKLKNGVWKN